MNVKKPLLWWNKDANLRQGRKYTSLRKVQLFTNASLLGWGVTFNNTPAQGQWTPQKSSLMINVFELRAIRLALLHFRDQVFQLPVLIRMDCISAKAYIKTRVGRDQLHSRRRPPNYCIGQNLIYLA